MSPLLWLPGRALAGHVLAATAADFRARRTARVLRGMSDHMLADIGIARDQIGSAAHSLEPLSRHARLATRAQPGATPAPTLNKATQFARRGPHPSGEGDSHAQSHFLRTRVSRQHGDRQ